MSLSCATCMFVQLFGSHLPVAAGVVQQSVSDCLSGSREWITTLALRLLPHLTCCQLVKCLEMFRIMAQPGWIGIRSSEMVNGKKLDVLSYCCL